ncbi:MAG: ribosomal protein methyltransferase [Bacillales bacterium]|jgi:ribosomal protein L11 methyltransferase|nr:ribosomal protein methyltransferase [Bacillales bacterium]
MKWSEVSIHSTNEAVEAISNILLEAGAYGVSIEDPAELIKERDNVFGEIYQLNPADFPAEGVMIKAYYSSDEFNDEVATTIKANVDQLADFDLDLGHNTMKISEVDEEDWATAWKKYYHPEKISETVTVVPTWEEYTPLEGEKIISLDPGMAFGTGTHPTTVLCVRAIEKYVKTGHTVLDVGTGSGVLSVAAALFGASRIQAMDLDNVAVTVAKDNCEVNKVGHIVEVFQNNLLNGIETKANVIVANILAEIIVLFTDDVARLLQDDGVFITSGIIEDKKQRVIDALLASGLEIVEENKISEWVSLVAKVRK